MHRHAVQARTPSGFLDRTLSDDESLLIQLCEYLHRSGFLYDDSSAEEIGEGEAVLQDFFNQESVVFQSHLPRERLNHFLKYLQGFHWEIPMMKRRLRLKLLSAFRQLSQGQHHHFNVRRGILEGLQESNTGPLHDFLLFIEAYKVLFLQDSSPAYAPAPVEEETQDEHYSINDILQLRRKVQERLGVHQVMGGLLERIAQERGTSVEALRDTSAETSGGLVKKSSTIVTPHSHQPVQFIRPSQRYSSSPNIHSASAATEFVPPSFSSSAATEFTAPMPESDFSSENFVLDLEPEMDLGIELEPELDLEMGLDPELEVEMDLEIPVAEDLEDTPEEPAATPEPETVKAAPAKKTPASIQDLLGDFDDEEDDDEEDDGLQGSHTSESEVVFGSGRISKASTEEFILKYPDSALKFLLRKSIDGRPLPAGFSDIYSGWQDRGLSRKRVKQFFFDMMKWKEFPKSPPHIILSKIKDELYHRKQVAGEE